MTEVTFPTLSPRVLTDMHDPKILAQTVTGRGLLHLPPGKGPFPAVVVMEGLGGLKKSRELWYGKFLAEHGYAALVVDSFGARGTAGYKHNLRAMLVTEAMMLADAFAALAYMRAQPAVRPDSVAIFGFSYGGMVSVLTAYRQIRELYLGRDGVGFAGHIAYYGCSVPRLEDPTTTGAPILLQIAEFDRNVSVPRTHEIVEDLRRGGSPVDLVVYNDTFHQWDGADVKKRFVQFALPDTRIHVGRDHSMRDERTGLKVTGRISRAVAILASVDPRGYHILRDESVIAESNRRTLSFLHALSARNRQDRMTAGLREGSSRPARRASSPR